MLLILTQALMVSVERRVLVQPWRIGSTGIRAEERQRKKRRRQRRRSSMNNKMQRWASRTGWKGSITTVSLSVEPRGMLPDEGGNFMNFSMPGGFPIIYWWKHQLMSQSCGIIFKTVRTFGTTQTHKKPTHHKPHNAQRR
jgi:hypothetical protein